MKEGLSLQEMAAEITRQNELKADYLVDNRNLRMETCNGQVYLHMYDKGTEPVEPLGIGSIAHRQLGTHLNIPASYYDKMLTEDPGLLTQNVNAWLERTPSTRMLRTMGGTARAFLSSRYKRIDNMEVATAVLPVLSGTIISNSETGMGAVNVQPLVYRLVCKNGMIVNDARTRRNHVGRANEADENFLLYSEQTLAADDKAFLLKIQDTVKAVVDETRFSQVVGLMQQAKGAAMDTHDIPGIVRLASRDFKITENESTGVLQHLIEGKDLTLYGLSNAITRYSQDVESYDRATELEGIGYNVLSMPASQWKRINQAAA